MLDWPHSSWISVGFLQENRADWEQRFVAPCSIDGKAAACITSLGVMLSTGYTLLSHLPEGLSAHTESKLSILLSP